MNKHTMSDLYSMQAAPLSVKVKMTARRIRDWVDEFGQDGVYVSLHDFPKFFHFFFIITI